MTSSTQASLAVFAAAAAAAALSLPAWRSLCARVHHVDDPGHRKIHARSIPLAGGFAVATGWLLGALVAWVWAGWVGTAPAGLGVPWSGEEGLRRILVPGIATAGILFLGAWDDRRDLGAGWKFLGQTAIAGFVVVWGVPTPMPGGLDAFGIVLAMLWILGVTNAFNLSDNMNGLCAGLGLVGGGSIWASSLLQPGARPELACAAALVAGGLAGYLPYNYPRASVFLGDAGSQSVGFLLAVLSLQTLPAESSGPGLSPRACIGALAPVAVPCIDLVFVTVARTLRGQPFWIGDTGHLSHRLSRTRLGKAGAVALLWALAVLLLVLASWIR
ncbi:MAG: undecaprenyl/decaprenyl-phosphate alpha-N-acetylglucosaminyl 1-phosphate transferase [Verrucomicrobium sp.]|nr:undecaprenyl/decaprenyl-phosphate alpha-N-acetylglucosaminyl 1-phosphate transferase [Verrucomicrobium sp.]